MPGDLTLWMKTSTALEFKLSSVLRTKEQRCCPKARLSCDIVFNTGLFRGGILHVEACNLQYFLTKMILVLTLTHLS